MQKCEMENTMVIASYTRQLNWYAAALQNLLGEANEQYSTKNDIFTNHYAEPPT